MRDVLKPAAELWAKLPDGHTRLPVERVLQPARAVDGDQQHAARASQPRRSRTWAGSLVNTTIGIVGCFDVATELGLEKHREDFGQTLGVWGFEPGPYLVLPIFGPSNVRDAIGIFGVEPFLDLNF